MFLCFDVGNTHITCALIDLNKEIIFEVRIATRKDLTEDEIFSYLLSSCDFRNINIKKVNTIIISSVVPELDDSFIFLCKKYFYIDPFFINADKNLPFEFDINNKYETGCDRISNIAGAISSFPNNNLCIIDFGTATTFEVVKDKKFIGGFIIPGINLQSKALYFNTAKLPFVKVEKTNRNIGKTTLENINKGIYYGYIGQIKELISIVKEIAQNIIIIGTGGLTKVIKNEIQIDHYIPDLCFKGMIKIYELNKIKKST